MNRNLYRIVFNRASGLFRVVAEIARGNGRSASGATAAGDRFSASISRLRFAWVLGQALIVPTASAQIVADPSAPGSQRPTVLEAANGVPLVNIRTPSAAGVSRNTYKQFDVDRQGAILNNARSNTQTELGGWVQGNPWLARGTARVILNELNSSDPSRLHGYVEVAGARAQLVIANPAGISCDGCGFINADRATISTGKPKLNGGSLEGYSIEGGAIRVQGKGMDASGADYTDLIARSVEANAGIWAQQLTVTTGANEVGADHAKARKTAGRGDAPAFALDVGALGGMYSQKIVLVGTEHGLGMRNAGAIGAQAGQLVVTVEGRLENSGTMQARTDTRIEAGGGVANAGTLSAGRELAIRTPKDIDNSKGTLNARRIEAGAQSLRNRGGAIEQTGAQALALRAAHLRNRDEGRIGSAATDTGTPPDSNGSGGSEGAGSAAPDDADSGGDGGAPVAGVAPLANGVLDIASTLDNAGGRIVAGGDIDITAKAGLDNDGGRLGVRRLDVGGGDLSNRKGEIKVAADARIAAALLNNDAGLMQLAGPVGLSAQDFSNRAGTFQHSDQTNTHVKVKGLLDNSQGTLASNAKRLTLDAGRLVNTDARIAHAGDGGLQVNAGSFKGVGGETATAGAVTLRLGDSDHRNATLRAIRYDLAAQSFDNRGGKVIATGTQANRIDVAATLDNGDGGTLASNADLGIHARTLGNAEGKILHAGDGRLDIQAGTLRGRNGTIVSNGALGVKGETTDLTGASTQAKAITVDTGTLITAKGKLVASGSGPLGLKVRGMLDNRGGMLVSAKDLAVMAGALDNRDGGLVVSMDGKLDVDTLGRTENAGGTLQGRGDVKVANGGLGNAGGTVLGANVQVDTRLASLDNAGGTIASITGTLGVVSGALNNAGGLLQSALAMRVDTQGQALVNTDAGSAGGILSGDALALATGSLDNRGGIVHGQGDAVVRTGVIDNTDGRLGGNADVDIEATSLVNNGGLTVAGMAIKINASQILNRDTQSVDASKPLGLQGASVALSARHVDNTGGTIVADDHVGVRGAGAGSVLDNTRGTVTSGGGIEVAVDRVANRHGTFLAGKSLGMTVERLGGDGSLLSQGDLRLVVQQDFSNYKEITANGRAVISSAGLLTNLGLIQAGDLEARGANVDNTATGTMSGGRSTVGARDTLTNRGLIDGSQTQIAAGTVNNVGTGRVYGDRLAIEGGTLNNREEAGQAAVIAARQRLDIGAGVIDNREQALIFSAGGGSDALSIGGALDADYRATGRASLILNDSATIESLGGLTIDTSRLLNRNLHFSTVMARVAGPTKHFYIQPEGTLDKRDADEYRWENWSRAGRYRHKVTGAEIREWTQFDVTRTEYETQVTESAPSLIRSGGDMTLRGEELVNDKSRIIAGGALQGDLDRLNNIAAFGEHVTRQSGTSQFTYSRWRGGLRRYHERKWDSKIAYKPADIVQTVAFDVSKVAQNAAGNGSGFTVDGRQTGQVGGTVGGSAGASGGLKQITEVQAEVNGLNGPGSQQGGPVDGASGGAPMVIRSVQVDTDAPANSLFRTGPNAGGYMVETDPRYADYRNWLSSDYMLSQLGHDPARVSKRLGDGFYEQKLVRDQIDRLTGRRLLEGYANDEAQYRALLEAGATYAKKWNLRPGVALSAAQMAQLTSDIVWLVERDVTLADGRSTRALVPQVYVRVKPGDLNGRGALMAADAVNLNLMGDLVNAGTIVGRTAVKLSAENLRNLDGRITGNAVALKARTDIDNIGGVLDADSTLLLSAGRDVNIVSTTRSDARQAGQSDFSRTDMDRVAGLYVTNPGGILLATAGRDANLTAARIVNKGKDGKTAVVAGRDLTLGAVRIAEQENNVLNAGNYLKQGEVRDVGTTVDSAGDVRLQAGRDLTAIAANVTSEKGALTAIAQGDVNILAGVAGSNWAEGRQHKSTGLLGSSEKTTRNNLEDIKAVSSTFSGNTVAVQGENLTLAGGNVVSDARTVVVAGNDLIIREAVETSSESHFKETRKSGILYDGGLAFTVGSQMRSGDSKNAGTRAAASTVGSTSGDVMLAAGNEYRQIGSQVLAPKGDIDIRAKKVNIVEARETGTSTRESKFRQSGLTVALTSPVISAILTGQQMKRAADNTSDTRMKALAAATTGLAALNAYDAVSADPKAAGGLNISVTVGSSKNDSKSASARDTAAGSTVAAGGNVRVRATGAGQDSDLTVRGSTIGAGGNARLKADGDIKLLAAENTVESDRASSRSSAGVGVAISVGQGGFAMGATANASLGKGKGVGKDVTWTNTHVNAGERLTLESGGDTTLRGAVAGGRQVAAEVGGNLNIESLQDSSAFKSEDGNIGGSVTVGMGFSGGVNVGQQRIDSDYASVIGRSRIEAGDEGFQIKVQGNTGLKGAAITSSEQAAKDGVNTLTTGTLTTGDIENRAAYGASSISIGGGNQVPGTTLPARGSFSAGPPIAMAASGNSSTTTRSGISGAQISITDEAGQQALTGQTADERIASLNRDVLTGQDGANALKPIFNEREIKAGFEIVGAFQRETGTFLNNRAKEATAAKLALEQELAKPVGERDAARLAELQRRLADSAAWAPGGAGRQVLTALAAAAGGNVTGASHQLAQNLVVNYLQQQGAGYIGKLVKDGKLIEGSPTHAALHAIVACAGAAAGNQDCGSGALGAATSSLLTKLFSDSPDETPAQKEAKRNLVTSLVAGIALAGGPDVATAVNSAASAADNNWLTQSEVKAANKAIEACGEQGGDVQACKNQVITAMNELDKARDRKLFEGKRQIEAELHRRLVQAAAACGSDIDCFQQAEQKIRSWVREQHLQLSSSIRAAHAAGELVRDGYYPDGRVSAMWQGALGAAEDLPGKVGAFGTYVYEEGVTGVAADIADGIKQSGTDFIDWMTSDLPHQAVDRKVDNVLTLHAGDIGGIVFNEAVGTLVGYAGGHAVQLVHGKWVPLAGKALDDFLDRQVEQALLRSGGAYGRDGRPLLDLKTLTNDQKRVAGEQFGENFVKVNMPNGKKLARVQGVGTNGIDDLYSVNHPDIDYVVIEYKFGTSRLKRTADGLQMSDAWLTGAKTNFNRILDAVGDTEKALDIGLTLDAGRVERWVVHTDPHGVVTVGIVDKEGKFITKPEAASKILKRLK